MKLKCGRSIGHIIKHAVFKCQMAMKRICGIFCNCFIMWERRYNMNDITNLSANGKIGIVKNVGIKLRIMNIIRFSYE